MKQFLNEDSELIQELKEKKIEACFDIGFTIDVPDYMSKSLHIDKNLLKQMAEAEIELYISSYLASEDD